MFVSYARGPRRAGNLRTLSASVWTDRELFLRELGLSRSRGRRVWDERVGEGRGVVGEEKWVARLRDGLGVDAVSLRDSGEAPASGVAQVSELRGVRRVVVVWRRGGRRRLTFRFPASFASLTALKHGAVAFPVVEGKAEVVGVCFVHARPAPRRKPPNVRRLRDHTGIGFGIGISRH